jgi:DNA-binding NarL/FixJ family response regulator
MLQLACAGHSNKDIAHALSVSASTVGVLLFRAAGKLNASSRNDLLTAYKRLIASSKPEASSSGSTRRLKR